MSLEEGLGALIFNTHPPPPPKKKKKKIKTKNTAKTKLSGFLSIRLLNSLISGFACGFFCSELTWLISDELVRVSVVS